MHQHLHKGNVICTQSTHAAATRIRYWLISEMWVKVKIVTAVAAIGFKVKIEIIFCSPIWNELVKKEYIGLHNNLHLLLEPKPKGYMLPLMHEKKECCIFPVIFYFLNDERTECCVFHQECVRIAFICQVFVQLFPRMLYFSSIFTGLHVV